MFICFCQCFIWRTQKANTTGGYKSHLCFPIITNWNTNKGLFDSLFVFPIEWHQTKKQRKAYTEQVVSVFYFLMLRMKNENGYNGSYSYIPFPVFELGKGKRNLHYPIPISIMESENKKTTMKGRYIQHMVLFRFSCFHFAKEKTKICITDHISIFRFLFEG